MNHRAEKFHPGWKMTVPQYGRYWREVAAVRRKLNSELGTRNPELSTDEVRQMIHQRAFGGHKSAKAINHLKDFDDFIAAVAALLDPANVEKQMRQAGMPETRLIYAIKKLAPAAYIIAEARRKFHTEDWEGLNVSDLTMLRNHLAARAADIRWPGEVRSGRCEVRSEEMLAAGDI